MMFEEPLLTRHDLDVRAREISRSELEFTFPDQIPQLVDSEADTSALLSRTLEEARMSIRFGSIGALAVALSEPGVPPKGSIKEFAQYRKDLHLVIAGLQLFSSSKAPDSIRTLARAMGRVKDSRGTATQSVDDLALVHQLAGVARLGSHDPVAPKSARKRMHAREKAISHLSSGESMTEHEYHKARRHVRQLRYAYALGATLTQDIDGPMARTAVALLKLNNLLGTGLGSQTNEDSFQPPEQAKALLEQWKQAARVK